MPLDSAPASAPPLGRAARHRKRSPWQVQRDVLFALIVREAHARVGGQWVGAVWTLIEPLAHTMLFVVLYGILVTNSGSSVEYPVFLAVGMVTFFFFQNLESRLMDGIEANRGVFAYRQVQPADVLLARAVIEFLMNLLVFVFTMAWLGWLGYQVVPNDPLATLGVTLLVAAFGGAYGLLLAMLTHERPRVRSVVRMTALPLYLSSGVMFKVDLLPREYIEILLWNPMLHLVELSRHAFITAYVPTPGVNAAYPMLMALLIMAWGLALYRAKRNELVAS
jgi:capsular polysaccharide transport system permease protein